MNYLAHAFLSGNNEDLLLGNFIADHLRGGELRNYQPGVAAGIILHRKIDSFTDQHPLFRASKRLFYNGFEKHSGILVDIYFDHLLARDFPKYSLTALDEFSHRVYKVYRAQQTIIPVSSQRFLDYITNNGIYQSYASETGISTVLQHLSQRIRHGVHLHYSLDLFQKHEKQLAEYFSAFFEEARRTFDPK